MPLLMAPILWRETPTSPPPARASCHRTLGPTPIATPSCSTKEKRHARDAVEVNDTHETNRVCVAALSRS
jgi:hypothetical protein